MGFAYFLISFFKLQLSSNTFIATLLIIWPVRLFNKGPIKVENDINPLMWKLFPLLERFLHVPMHLFKGIIQLTMSLFYGFLRSGCSFYTFEMCKTKSDWSKMWILDGFCYIFTKEPDSLVRSQHIFWVFVDQQSDCNRHARDDFTTVQGQ